MKIIIAENDKEYALLLENAIRKITGITPIIVNSCNSLKKVLSDLISKQDFPNLIISDVDFPDGSILECIVDIKKSMPPIPLIATSYKEIPQDKLNSIHRVGFKTFIPKSSSIDILENYIISIATLWLDERFTPKWIKRC